MKKTFLFLSIPALSLGLAGCESVQDTYDDPQVRRDAAIGAGVGAVAGGIIGHQQGNAIEGAAIGAAIGGAGGTIVGKERSEDDEEVVVDEYDVEEVENVEEVDGAVVDDDGDVYVYDDNDPDDY